MYVPTYVHVDGNILRSNWYIWVHNNIIVLIVYVLVNPRTLKQVPDIHEVV